MPHILMQFCWLSCLNYRRGPPHQVPCRILCSLHPLHPSGSKETQRWSSNWQGPCQLEATADGMPPFPPWEASGRVIITVPQLWLQQEACSQEELALASNLSSSFSALAHAAHTYIPSPNSLPMLHGTWAFAYGGCCWGLEHHCVQNLS